MCRKAVSAAAGTSEHRAGTHSQPPAPPGLGPPSPAPTPPLPSPGTPAGEARGGRAVRGVPAPPAGHGRAAGCCRAAPAMERAEIAPPKTEKGQLGRVTPWQGGLSLPGPPLQTLVSPSLPQDRWFSRHTAETDGIAAVWEKGISKHPLFQVGLCLRFLRGMSRSMKSPSGLCGRSPD